MWYPRASSWHANSQRPGWMSGTSRAWPKWPATSLTVTVPSMSNTTTGQCTCHRNNAACARAAKNDRQHSSRIACGHARCACGAPGRACRRRCREVRFCPERPRRSRPAASARRRPACENARLHTGTHSSFSLAFLQPNGPLGCVPGLPSSVSRRKCAGSSAASPRCMPRSAATPLMATVTSLADFSRSKTTCQSVLLIEPSWRQTTTTSSAPIAR